MPNTEFRKDLLGCSILYPLFNYFSSAGILRAMSASTCFVFTLQLLPCPQISCKQGFRKVTAAANHITGQLLNGSLVKPSYPAQSSSPLDFCILTNYSAPFDTSNHSFPGTFHWLLDMLVFCSLTFLPADVDVPSLDLWVFFKANPLLSDLLPLHLSSRRDLQFHGFNCNWFWIPVAPTPN